MSMILLVGCGRMGEALASGWLTQGRDPDTIMIVEPNQDFASHLITKGVKFFSTADELTPNDIPTVVIFAVKPQAMDEVVPAYRRFVSSAVFISIAAGKTIGYFESILGVNAAIVRVMPNTPAAVQRGIAGAIGNTNVTSAQCNACTALIEAVSELHWLENENQIDFVTAISGSGPAYVFLLAECLAETGRKLGLPDKLAERLGRVTVSGSGELLHRSEEDLVTLRQNVTSKGGTTEAALNLLMAEDGLQTLMNNAVKRAAERSKELAS